jgi:hypothetical protein
MKPIILLDVNGVLNPKQEAGGHSGNQGPQLSDLKLSLVRRLATKGRIAWVSSSPSDLMDSLEAQLGLEAKPLRVRIEPEPGDDDQQTPKLASVARWLGRMDAESKADWDAVVWIDDELGADVHGWAHQYSHPRPAGEAARRRGSDRSPRRGGTGLPRR